MTTVKSLPPVASGYETSAAGPICFTVMLDLQLPASYASVSALQFTLVAIVALNSFLSFKTCEFVCQLVTDPCFLGGTI